MKMHRYFLLNIKHGASQLYLVGGGLKLFSAGTAYRLRLPPAVPAYVSVLDRTK